MLSRLIPPLKFTHAWCGRAYIIFMIINIGTSLIIHNEGLPPAVLVSFIWVLGGLCLAWIFIVIYKMIFQSKLVDRVDAKVRSEGLGKSTLSEIMTSETKSMLEEQTWMQRLFSLKAAHGALMFTSWVNIAGRIFASNQSSFVCYTAPAYKPVYRNVSFVAMSDPNFSRLPWARLGTAGWGALLLFAPLLAALIFGVCYVLVTEALKKRRAAQLVAASQLEMVEK